MDAGGGTATTTSTVTVTDTTPAVFDAVHLFLDTVSVDCIMP
jgi:hypothetical protein